MKEKAKKERESGVAPSVRQNRGGRRQRSGSWLASETKSTLGGTNDEDLLAASKALDWPDCNESPKHVGGKYSTQPTRHSTQVSKPHGIKHASSGYSAPVTLGDSNWSHLPRDIAACEDEDG